MHRRTPATALSLAAALLVSAGLLAPITRADEPAAKTAQAAPQNNVFGSGNVTTEYLGEGYVCNVRVGKSANLGQLFSALTAGGRQPINILWTPKAANYADMPIPEANFRNVTGMAVIENVLFAVNNDLSEKGVMLTARMPRSPQTNVSETPTLTIVLENVGSAGSDRAGKSNQQAEKAAAVNTEFFPLGGLFESMKRAARIEKPQESLLAALHDGLVDDTDEPPQLSVHTETGTLMVKGTAKQINAVRSALAAIVANVAGKQAAVNKMQEVEAAVVATERRLAAASEQSSRLLSMSKAAEKTASKAELADLQRRSQILADEEMNLRSRLDELRAAMQNRYEAPALPKISPSNVTAATDDLVQSMRDEIAALKAEIAELRKSINRTRNSTP